ncbi:ADP-ribosylglycohydrolase family protein [Trabulsiella odontotermitis]|uniref:ADP-ribosylglycohydrolase n=1 Tax=Trabulsiella odontotermitis TaxID=379893 RepID=A0A0L0GMS5_9ENTR|nr:ADP-ribosylglycohydrolase family protein [Trabulsiella odontotermitis]KNC90370.1 ADP-ribosylglycohydrolase [Trabulsiella odontotermitis]KNC91868.1 ADP-ribosylglycohydrolase [Trabulsiella odontotermitis]
MAQSRADYYNKVLGALACGGMGDALGASTELYTIDEIKSRFDGFIDAFHTPPKDTFAGSLEGVCGLITDDASQMYVFAEGLIETGKAAFDTRAWTKCLLRWADMQPYANYKGPTTEQVVKALKEGKPTNTIGRIGTSARQAPNVGTTNGAAMRVAPAGLVYPGEWEKACELAFATCLPSHDTNIAIASACAIAAGVATAMTADATVDSILASTLNGALYGEQLAAERARVVAGPKIEHRLRLALNIAQNNNTLETFLRELEGYVGNSVNAHESVPSAIAIFAFCQGDPWQTIYAAANAGNDTDSIGTMAGAMAGAYKGFSALPLDKYQFFYQVNKKDFDVERIARELSALC